MINELQKIHDLYNKHQVNPATVVSDAHMVPDDDMTWLWGYCACGAPMFKPAPGARKPASHWAIILPNHTGLMNLHAGAMAYHAEQVKAKAKAGTKQWIISYTGCMIYMANMLLTQLP